MKNELELKQSHEISKLNLLNEKVNKSGNFTAWKTKSPDASFSSISFGKDFLENKTHSHV